MPYSEPVAALSAATNWRKASYSEGDQNGRVEVGNVPGFVGVRHTKLGDTSPILACTEAEWAAFLAGVKNHEFDL
jgi:predicted secreted Zn-dependent protease